MDLRELITLFFQSSYSDQFCSIEKELLPELTEPNNVMSPRGWQLSWIPMLSKENPQIVVTIELINIIASRPTKMARVVPRYDG
jgi:hypothetical protein